MVCGEMSITRQANCFRSPPKSRLFQSQYRPGRSTAMPASRCRPAAAASLSGIGLGICRSSGAISPLECTAQVLMNFLSKWLCPPSLPPVLNRFHGWEYIVQLSRQPSLHGQAITLAFRKSGAAWLRARAISFHAGTCTHHIMSAATEIEYSRTHALSKVRAMTCPSIQATSWPHAYARHPADL